MKKINMKIKNKFMKTIKEMTEKEILALNQDAIDRIIKLSYATEGIKILKEPVGPIYQEIPIEDKTLYKVNGCDLYFEKKEVAEEVAKVLRNNFGSLRKKQYDYYDGDSKYYDEPLSKDYSYEDGVNSIQATEHRIYSTELYLQIKDKLEENKRLKTAYEKDKKEYDSLNTDAKWITDEIYEKIAEVKEKQRNRDDMLEKFNEYLKLAEKNEDVAWNFLKKAYTIDEDIISYIKANKK